MSINQHKSYTKLEVEHPIWEHTFTVAPLVIIGSKENSGFDLAPKHMACPMGFGNYFGFVCTPEHNTYGNIKENGEFTVSFPRPEQILATSISASPRNDAISKSEGIVAALPTIKASIVDAPLVAGAYLYLECELFKIIDGFDKNSLITGKIKAAYTHNDYMRVSDSDEGEQLLKNHLLAYIAPGRFAEISATNNFPYPKDFKR
ncbi:flavin reductase family protein [Muriicola sp. Z0-33]|uniref:flavin reductase family protein n=1 Tax=Muriicola sp. Z0-33 TaxID=2816957 RepID=UPI00223729A7|nr:flavin reductase family protein [Muriicola sp. Z0-33]MCW5517978.1 flavin reductase [Muriicola sp. Z0-33]